MYGNIKKGESTNVRTQTHDNLRKDDSLMVSIKKRLVALLMTLVMALSLSATAFAAEPTNIIVEDPATASVSEETSTMSLGKQLAFGAGTITGGSGSVSVYLPSGNFWADLVATIGYSSNNDIVICSVVTPDGDDLSLGAIAGTGSSTSSYELFYAPAGTYTFYFYTANPLPVEVAAYIYD